MRKWRGGRECCVDLVSSRLSKEARDGRGTKLGLFINAIESRVIEHLLKQSGAAQGVGERQVAFRGGVGEIPEKLQRELPVRVLVLIQRPRPVDLLEEDVPDLP